jgi:hypothetical protein
MDVSGYDAGFPLTMELQNMGLFAVYLKWVRTTDASGGDPLENFL